MLVNSAKIAKCTVGALTARFSCARSATTSNILKHRILTHKKVLSRKEEAIRESEFVKNAKNKNAQHSVSVVNNFCVCLAVTASTKRAQGKSTRGRV